MIDVNTNLSRWPARRVAGDETADFVAKLRSQDVEQAWAGSFDGILHKDTDGVNSRLAAECLRYGRNFLIPFGSVNPMLPDWQEDLRRCRAKYRMPGIKIHPNYHGYKITDPVFAELLRLATQQRLIVQVAVVMEDARKQSRLLHVPPVDLTGLLQVIQGEPAARLLLLNWPAGVSDDQQVESLARTGSVWFDIAMVEGIEGVGRLTERVPAEKILFGSNFPLYCFESALLKIQESRLSEGQKRSVTQSSARSLLAWSDSNGM